MPEEGEVLMCAVCGKERAVGVASIPGVPASDAYGQQCLDANAHPMWALVSNTAMMGGLDGAADWWIDMVDCTLRHLGISREDFDYMVEELADKMP